MGKTAEKQKFANPILDLNLNFDQFQMNINQYQVFILI